jgi:uncharacterized membrane protein YfcA
MTTSSHHFACAGTSRQEEPTGTDEPIGADAHALRSVKAPELALRAGFGAAISVIAGVISLVFNPVVGGMFLAFPAILPATITLIEKKQDAAQAAADVKGATLGAVALGVFAVIAGLLLRSSGAVVALLAALGAWCATALALYAVSEKVRARVRRGSGRHTGSRRET